MYPRVNYEMTEADLAKLQEAFKPVPYMIVGGVAPRSQQENANAAWEELGKRMGFDYNTVQPISGKGIRFFSAVPTENETERMGRAMREADEAKRAKIEALRSEISEKQKQLRNLEESPCADN